MFKVASIPNHSVTLWFYELVVLGLISLVGRIFPPHQILFLKVLIKQNFFLHISSHPKVTLITSNHILSLSRRICRIKFIFSYCCILWLICLRYIYMYIHTYIYIYIYIYIKSSIYEVRHSKQIKIELAKDVYNGVWKHYVRSYVNMASFEKC